MLSFTWLDMIRFSVSHWLLYSSLCSYARLRYLHAATVRAYFALVFYSLHLTMIHGLLTTSEARRLLSSCHATSLGDITQCKIQYGLQ